VGRCIKKIALAKVKHSRITQRTEARPIIPRMKQLPQQGAAHHNAHRNLFAPRSRRILRTSALASIRSPQGKCSLHSHSTGREGRCYDCTIILCKINFEPISNGPVLLFAPPAFLVLPFLFHSRAKVDGRSCLPDLVLAKGGGPAPRSAARKALPSAW
jgi:hypothetical protein